MDYWILLDNNKPITKTQIISGSKTNNFPFTYNEAIGIKTS